jgi:hypothetical protein
MLTPKKRLRFYVGTYLVIAFIAIVGLVINNETMKLNASIRQYHRKIDLLEEKNKRLQLVLLHETSLGNLEIMAVRLAYAPPQKLYYLARP